MVVENVKLPLIKGRQWQLKRQMDKLEVHGGGGEGEEVGGTDSRNAHGASHF